MEKFKNLQELIELSKEEIENNNPNISATLDLTDLKELDDLLDLYKKEKEKNKEYEDFYGTPPTFEDSKYIEKNKIREKIKELDKKY